MSACFRYYLIIQLYLDHRKQAKLFSNTSSLISCKNTTVVKLTHILWRNVKNISNTFWLCIGRIKRNHGSNKETTFWRLVTLFFLSSEPSIGPQCIFQISKNNQFESQRFYRIFFGKSCSSIEEHLKHFIGSLLLKYEM